MNVKESLEYRIRGWFPKEINLSANSPRLDKEHKVLPVINLEAGSVRANRSFIIFAVFGVISSILFINQANSVYYISITVQAILVSAGLLLGSLYSLIYDSRIFKTIDKKGVFSLSLKEWLITYSIFAVVALLIMPLFPILAFGAWQPVFFSSFVAASGIMTLAEFTVYEKRMHVFLIGRLFGDYYVIPKSSAASIKEKLLPNINLDLGTKSGTRMVTFLLMALTLLLVGTAYYASLINSGIALVGSLFIVGISVLVSIVINYRLKEAETKV